MPVKRAASCNKYNVRAVRKELDSCIRSQSWKRFRSTLDNIIISSSDTDQDTDTSLIRSVVLERTKSNRGVPSNHPTLLHALISKIDSTSGGGCTLTGHGKRRTQHPPPYNIIDTIASQVPEALLVQDPKTGRTPLHLAVYHNACPLIVECLIKHDDDGDDKGKKSLASANGNGDTPLLCAIRSQRYNVEDQEGVIGMLLKYDTDGKTLLMPNTGIKRRGKVPLYFLAVDELKYWHKGKRVDANELLRNSYWGNVSTVRENRLPDAVRFMLVKTYDALKNGDSLIVPRQGEQNEEMDEIDTATALHAAIACSHLLAGHAATVFSVLLLEAEESGDIDEILSATDKYGNNPMHALCSSINRSTSIAPVRTGPICGTSYTSFDQDYGDLFEVIIRHCPETLGQPNADGDLPLHLAIQRGRSSGQIRLIGAMYPDASRCRNKKGELPLHTALKNCATVAGVAKEIWRLWPDALAQRDGDTGLYPFQIAALQLHDERMQPRGVYMNELLAMEASYFFLRQRPDLCSSSLEHPL